MWKLLTGDFDVPYEGCIPATKPIEYQNKLPTERRIGFTDVVLLPGNDAAAISDSYMRTSVPSLHKRLLEHVDRVRKNESKEDYFGPSIIAFTGKRQFLMMYPRKKDEPKGIPFGKVPPHLLPANWPLPKDKCQVWVLPSSSGRAVMTHEQRAAPYRSLAEEYRRIMERDFASQKN